VLDEIDKVSGNNINGDPEAALLEVLDQKKQSLL
jgi:ATP-dependent Lon protease